MRGKHLNAFTLRDGCDVPVVERLTFGRVLTCSVSVSPAPGQSALILPTLLPIDVTGCAEIKFNGTGTQLDAAVPTVSTTFEGRGGDNCAPNLDLNIGFPCPPLSISGSASKSSSITDPTLNVTSTSNGGCDREFNINLQLPETERGDPCIIKIRNNSGGAVEENNVLGLSGFEDESEIYVGTTITANNLDNFAITIADIAAGEVGYARICGIVRGMSIKADGTGFKFATGIAGSKTQLQAQGGGAALALSGTLTNGSNDIMLDSASGSPAHTVDEGAGTAFVIDRSQTSGQALEWNPKANLPANWKAYTRVEVLDTYTYVNGTTVNNITTKMVFAAETCPVIKPTVAVAVSTTTC